jgi:hypothetical protein
MWEGQGRERKLPARGKKSQHIPGRAGGGWEEEEEEEQIPDVESEDEEIIDFGELSLGTGKLLMYF